MNLNRKIGQQLPLFIFTGTLVILMFFIVWIASESDVEKVQVFYTKYEQFTLNGDLDGARSLHRAILKNEGDKPLSENWLKMVQLLSDRKVKLQYYIGILAGNPNREATYEEIRILINEPTDIFTAVEIDNYLSRLRQLKDVRNDLLIKYNL